MNGGAGIALYSGAGEYHFYTTANIDEKADTSNLKSIVAKAKVILPKAKGYEKTELWAAISKR